MKGQGSRQVGAARPRPSRRSSRSGDSPRAAESFPVVGLGASAGGLDAFRKLLDALPAGSGMAFILIQHLDPTHASMMVDLLAGHTPMTVQQAADGMPLEPEHVYLIPPAPISRSVLAPFACRSRASVTARACRSTSSCARWRKRSANARSA